MTEVSCVSSQCNGPLLPFASVARPTNSSHLPDLRLDFDRRARGTSTSCSPVVSFHMGSGWFRKCISFLCVFWKCFWDVGC